MTGLLDRARAYARSCDVDLRIIEGPEIGSWFAARHGPLTILTVSSGTVAGPHLSELVYQACVAITASRSLEINVHQPVRNLLAS